MDEEVQLGQHRESESESAAVALALQVVNRSTDTEEIGELHELFT